MQLVNPAFEDHAFVYSTALLYSIGEDRILGSGKIHGWDAPIPKAKKYFW